MVHRPVQQMNSFECESKIDQAGEQTTDLPLTLQNLWATMNFKKSPTTKKRNVPESKTDPDYLHNRMTVLEALKVMDIPEKMFRRLGEQELKEVLRHGGQEAGAEEQETGVAEQEKPSLERMMEREEAVQVLLRMRSEKKERKLTRKESISTSWILDI